MYIEERELFLSFDSVISLLEIYPKELIPGNCGMKGSYLHKNASAYKQNYLYHLKIKIHRWN